jgi:hypothetical protein
MTHTELPVLKADSAHWQIDRPEQPPMPYEAPSTGFVLDVSELPALFPPTAQKPNLIQFVLGRGLLYGCAWEDDRTTYPATAEELVPLFGSPPFPGFETGQQVILAVGHFAPGGEQDNRSHFQVLWVGLVKII